MIGWHSIADATATIDSAKALIASSETKINGFSSTIQALEERVKKDELEVSRDAVLRQNNRFQELIDDIDLDSVNQPEYDKTINELVDIINDVSKLKIPER